MKLVSKDGEELAILALTTEKGEPVQVTAEVLGKTIELPQTEVALDKIEDGLNVHIRIPGMVNFNIQLDKNDVKSMKGLMSGDAIKFFMKSFIG